MALYRASSRRPLSEMSPEFRLSNQVVMTGTDQELLVPKGAFFLEYLSVESGNSVTLSDGAGNEIVANLTDFNNDRVPLRCDGGIIAVGTVLIIKGFVLEDFTI